MTLPDAPSTRAEQFAFLRKAHDGPNVWRALCLSLARQAPGLPAVNPSARAAAEATPKAHRVPKVADLRRGMVAYFDDPNDSNTFGHIVTVAGWAGKGRTLNDLLVWSNDAARSGGVDMVRGSFFPTHWGDDFQFGAISLNGYMLPGYGTPAPSPGLPVVSLSAVRDAAKHPRRAVHHDDVRLIQKALSATGHYRGKWDGIYGSRTRQAVKSYELSIREQGNGLLDVLSGTKLGADRFRLIR